MGQVDAVRHGRVLVVRLTGGGANAMTSEMATSLEAIARGAATRPDIGALLITGGHGGAFCGGSNIRELAELHEAGQGPGALLAAESAAFEALAALDIPTLAAIEGAAVGGGLELALCCDLILATPDAQIALPEVKLGVYPALGGTVRLQQRIGEGRARELLLTGESIDGTTAHHWGLVNRLVPRVGLYRAARALADQLADGPMAATAAIKRGLREARVMDEAGAIDAALAGALAHAGSPEVEEGMRAFAAHETPDFTRTHHAPTADPTPLHPPQSKAANGRGRAR